MSQWLIILVDKRERRKNFKLYGGNFKGFGSMRRCNKSLLNEWRGIIYIFCDIDGLELCEDFTESVVCEKSI